MSRQRVLVLILAAMVVYFGWSRGSALIETGSALSGSAASSGRRSLVGADVDRLRTAVLSRKTGVFRPGRDLFRFRAAPAKPRVNPPPPAPKPQVEKVVPTPAKPPAPQPPRIDFTYMGSFGPAGSRIAVFTDSETIYNAMVGEVIKDVFLLANIGFESVDIAFVGFPDAEAQRLAVSGS